METIKENAKKPIIKLLNRALQVEYDLLFNYPRCIEHLANVAHINDEHIIESLEWVGKDSLRHFGEVDNLIKKLGGTTDWNIKVPSGAQNVEERLLKQLEKEEWAIPWYKEVKKVVEQNKVKAEGFISRLAGSESPEDVVNANDIIGMLDRIILDEERHQRLIQNMIDKLRVLMKK